jgi:hypothetical protein
MLDEIAEQLEHLRLEVDLRPPRVRRNASRSRTTSSKQKRARASLAPRPVLEARLGCRGSPVWLVLDSGIAAPVLFDHGEPALGLALGATVRAATNAGEAEWREARLDSLCVAGERSGPLRVLVRPQSAPARVEGGLLPSRFFARVRLGREGAVVAVDRW